MEEKNKFYEKDLTEEETMQKISEEETHLA
jgi:hypothetical protein